MMGQWVLMLAVIVPGFSNNAVSVVPVYFHDKPACEAAIPAMQKGTTGIKLGGICIPTSSALSPTSHTSPEE